MTGQLVRVDLVAQTAHVVNAGHPRPFRLHDGQPRRSRSPRSSRSARPRARPGPTQELPLQTGDRLLFLTDGMLERDAQGLDVPALMRSSAHLHPREAIQHLTHAVLAAVGGELKDDATSLCLDWHGGSQGDRARTPAQSTGLSANALLPLSNDRQLVGPHAQAVAAHASTRRSADMLSHSQATSSPEP